MYTSGTEDAETLEPSYIDVIPMGRIWDPLRKYCSFFLLQIYFHWRNLSFLFLTRISECKGIGQIWLDCKYTDTTKLYYAGVCRVLKLLLCRSSLLKKKVLNITALTVSKAILFSPPLYYNFPNMNMNGPQSCRLHEPSKFLKLYLGTILLCAGLLYLIDLFLQKIVSKIQIKKFHN